ncbi:unnamed protein product [Parajaminaea phylloscopi]
MRRVKTKTRSGEGHSEQIRKVTYAQANPDWFLRTRSNRWSVHCTSPSQLSSLLLRSLAATTSNNINTFLGLLRASRGQVRTSVVMRKARPRIGLLQFTPCHSDPLASRAKVERLCASITSDNGIDLLVAPELCLTGYIFESAEQIRSLSESVRGHASKSVTIELASQLSKRLGCYTLMGFPELVESNETASSAASDPLDSRPRSSAKRAEPRCPRWFNSAVLTSRDGTVLHVFRKHFLFTTNEACDDQDGLWAEEGPGFQYIDLPDIGRLACGICMDMNPYRFNEPFDKYELANWCLEQQVDILAMPMAWLSSAASKGEHTRHSEPDLEVINYWAMRCRPLWLPGLPSHSGRPKSTLLVTSNRTGQEGGESMSCSAQPVCWPILMGIFRTLAQRQNSQVLHVSCRSRLALDQSCLTACLSLQNLS